MVKVARGKPQKTDIDLELNEYEASEDSDDDYNSNEKLMLQQAAKRRAKLNDEDEESEEEVFGIHDSEDDEEEKEELEPLGDEMDSDIEGKEDDDDLPDSKAWGTKKKSYYNTDYVDQDYGGSRLLKSDSNEKYTQINERQYVFKALAFETLGPGAEETRRFFDAIGTLLIKESGDVRAKEYLHQRISLATQRGNAASVLGTLPISVLMDKIYIL